jgi:hypothetical protein
VIHHSAHPHICGRRVYNIGQKLGLWLGPHYIIAELKTKASSTETNSNSATTPAPRTNRSSSMTPSYISSAASSITNLSSLDDSTATTTSYQKQLADHLNSSGRGESTGSGGLGGVSSSGEEHHQEDNKQKERSSNSNSNGTTSSPWSSAKIVATIPSRWPLSICYMHSFSITHSYFILVEQPLSIYLPSFPIHQIYGDKPIASCLKFYPEEDTIFHVVSRHSRSSRGGTKGSSSRKSFRTNSFFFLHTINAFEMRDGDSDDTFIVIDICCYKDPSMIECMYVDALKVRIF